MIPRAAVLLAQLEAQGTCVQLAGNVLYTTGQRPSAALSAELIHRRREVLEWLVDPSISARTYTLDELVRGL